ncbi:hypothetical protein EDD21DRAFT_309126 [Dissophora ornata]|nr:hypothetical protein EDD21DRAFT_309126 [Dissophora ornata]
MSSTKFIQQNLSELIPKMILLNSPSLIEKLAMVLNEKVTALCIRQIDHILAAIYMQLSEESFQTCIDLLRRLIVQVEQDSGKETQSLDIVELTMLSSEGLVCCLSVELGDEDRSRREKAQMVIEIVEGYYWATQRLEKTRQEKGVEKPQLAVFLRRNILAIMSGVNNAILDRAQVFTLRVKAKYLRSLVTLVRLLNPIQSSVLSQIFPPLINALDIQGLRIHALGVLNEVVRLVEPGKLDVVLTHLIHTLMRYYPQSNDQERLVGLAILEFLIVDSQEALGSVLPDVGYLLNKPEFELMNQVLISAKTQHTIEQQLKRLAERSAHENAEIAEQALLELRDFLLENEHSVLDLTTTKDQDVAPVIKDLIHALLSGIGRFRGLDAPVPRRCVECLGIIGAVDPAKLSSIRLIPAPPVHTNFSDLEETKKFVCQLIEVQLVGKSRSIGDIHSETELAYTLQTLLSFCGITKDVLDSKTPTPPVAPQTRTTAEDRWKAFPRHVQEVLELLIDAKYTRAESSVQRTYRSPLYPDAKTFEKWLTLWTQVLIGKVTARYAKDVFQACKHVAQNDTSVCMYILPHLVLDVLVEGTETDRKEIVDEMAAVLGSGKDWREDGSEQTIGAHKQSSSEFTQLSSQTVFSLFDHISKWIQLRKNTSTKTAPTPRNYTTSIDLSQTKARNQDQTLGVVQAHLTSISQEVIAVAAFGCKAYARSLLHYEQHIRDARQQRGAGDLDIQAMYERLQKIYVHMEEPDGMDGISNLIQSDSETQNLLQCESAARWSEAQTYYELGMETDPEKFENHAGLYKCLDNLGHFDTLFSTVEGDIHVYPDWEPRLHDWRVATAWKVQRWQSLEIAISRSIQPSFETGLGQLILDMRENRAIDFEEHLRQVRSMLIPPLAAASMESYTRSYESIVQLAMLHELEVGSKGWNRSVSSSNTVGLRVATMPDGASYVERLRKYQLTLDKRFDSMAPSFRLREQVSRLRRVAFYDLSYLKETCGRLWLDTARAARKSGSSQISYSAMLHAEGLRDGSTTIERAKWEFIHKSERQAISSINAALKHSLASPASSSTIATRALANSAASNRQRQISSSGRRTALFNTDLQRVQDRVIDKNDIGFIRAKAHILRTRWMERNNLVSPADIVDGYRQATVECDRWEKGYYVAGQYYLKLYENSRRYKNRSPALGHVTSACRLYGKALTLGPKYLYQALPRLLTFWLELGHQATLRSEKNDAFMNSVCAEFQNVNTLMEGLAGYLPEYMFLSAFPQIISRICHKNPDAFAVLQHIIVNVVMAFPDQAIWQMVSVSRSIVPERKRVCNKILDSIHLQPRIGSAIVDQIREALDLCDNLIALCMAPVPDKVDKLSLERHFPRTHSQLRHHYNVTVPGQRTLWPTVPESSATVASHQPFKSNLPKINRFLDEVDVMSSLQRPRKITIVGSDGLHYTFLCKPKDDLRKDAKVMEFNNLVNMLLRKDREAHRRNLYIRTYAVVPLNEECGLIEWVHNTVPFRHIMQKLYKINSINLINILDIKRILDQDDNAKIFVKDLLPKFPPIFYQWFIDISAEPTAWFEARLRYTRTTAVMSMVGHIMGLGDRHGENLLFDNRNGDIVHVDFNCLFEQGKTFPKPEKVPFRLTQNMVDAMGLSGYDGVYRLACERTLQVFRDNTESLVSVLEGFIHDPLVEWSKSKRRGQQVQQEAGRADAAAAAEAADTQQNEKAQTILTIIKRKLSGTENANPYVLSVQGQVEELIQAATSPENLGKMYIGWSAYL